MTVKIGNLKVQVPLRLMEGILLGSHAGTHTDTLGSLVVQSLFSGRDLSLVLKSSWGISPAQSLPQHLWVQKIHPIQLSLESLCLL